MFRRPCFQSEQQAVPANTSTESAKTPVKWEGAKPGPAEVNVGQDVIENNEARHKQLVAQGQTNAAQVLKGIPANDEAKEQWKVVHVEASLGNCVTLLTLGRVRWVNVFECWMREQAYTSKTHQKTLVATCQFFIFLSLCKLVAPTVLFRLPTKNRNLDRSRPEKCLKFINNVCTFFLLSLGQTVRRQGDLPRLLPRQRVSIRFAAQGHALHGNGEFVPCPCVLVVMNTHTHPSECGGKKRCTKNLVRMEYCRKFSERNGDSLCGGYVEEVDLGCLGYPCRFPALPCTSPGSPPLAQPRRGMVSSKVRLLRQGHARGQRVSLRHVCRVVHLRGMALVSVFGARGVGGGRGRYAVAAKTCLMSTSDYNFLCTRRSHAPGFYGPSAWCVILWSRVNNK